MMWLRCFCLLLLGVVLGRAGEKPVIAPPPEWVAEKTLATLPPTPAEDAAYGLDFLLRDLRVHATRGEAYLRQVYRVTSEGALHSAARFEWVFDPLYEEVELHYLRVIRNGVATERLRAEEIKVIQQEADLERQMLNGHRTALVILEDIRVGDVIDYAATVRGRNPVFGGHYFDVFQTAWTVPVRQFRVEVAVRRGMLDAAALAVQDVGNAPALQEKIEGAQRRLTWEAADIAPVVLGEWAVPYWYDFFPLVRVSDFRSWAEVVEWALPLYALPEEIPLPVAQAAEEMTRGLSGAEEKALALLRFVQQDVRYLGMELGAGTHRPSPPEVVLARRFGDCKDKTLLFCALARVAGVKVFPALVHTEYKDRAEKVPPSPGSFDHVIAAIERPDGGYWWVDPTATSQAGDLEHRAVGDFRRALVIKAGGDGFSTVTVPPGAASRIESVAEFFAEEIGGPARLAIRTVYAGEMADAMRSYFAKNAPAQIAKEYLNDCARLYGKVESTAPVAWESDGGGNRLTVTENYRLSELWKQDGQGVWRLTVTENLISAHLERPQHVVRDKPLAVSFPLRLESEIRVRLPEEWALESEEIVRQESQAFAATLTPRLSEDKKTVILRYTWESKQDHVTPEALAEHLVAQEQMQEHAGYEFWMREPGGENAFRLNLTLLLAALSAVFPAAWLGWWLYRRKRKGPPEIPQPGDAQLRGLGGWLILLGVQTTLQPLILTGTFLHNFGEYIDLHHWNEAVEAVRKMYDIDMGILLVAEAWAGVLQIVLSGALAVAFFRKKQVFPMFCMSFFAFNLFALIADSAVTELLMGEGWDDEAIVAVLRVAFWGTIWSAYLLRSRRVKLTFVR